MFLRLLGELRIDRAGLIKNTQQQTIGMIMELTTTVNPYCLSPSWNETRDLPNAQRVAVMSDPAFRARILAKTPGDPTNPVARICHRFDKIFELDSDAPNYEPDRKRSIAARAKQLGYRQRSLHT